MERSERRNAMNIRNTTFIMVVLCLMMSCGLAHAVQIWDLATDFPVMTNPLSGPYGSISLPASSGPWSYGVGTGVVATG